MTLNHIFDVAGGWATGRTMTVSIATPDHLLSYPTKPVNRADPDVAALVQQLIDTADQIALRGSGE
jgi:hypothetical protein